MGRSFFCLCVIQFVLFFRAMTDFLSGCRVLRCEKSKTSFWSTKHGRPTSRGSYNIIEYFVCNTDCSKPRRFRQHSWHVHHTRNLETDTGDRYSASSV